MKVMDRLEEPFADGNSDSAGLCLWMLIYTIGRYPPVIGGLECADSRHTSLAPYFEALYKLEDSTFVKGSAHTHDVKVQRNDSAFLHEYLCGWEGRPWSPL